MEKQIAIMEKQLTMEMDASKAMSAYLRTGDLTSLPEPEKDKVLVKMCAHYGLDPIMRPFVMITLNGKQIWYPTKAATDQVAVKFKLTRELLEIKENVERGILECRVRIFQDANVRSETFVAAVSISEFVKTNGGQIVTKIISGEAYANALMKVESKAKRRATLGWLGITDYYENDGSEITDKHMVNVTPMAELQIEETKIHLADQVTATESLPTEPLKRGRKPGAVVSPKSKEPIIESLPTEPEPIIESELLPVAEPENLPIPEMIKYSRANDSHKHLMRLTLTELGINWTNPQHIANATKVSAAADNIAPCMDADRQFAKEPFTAWVSDKLNQLQQPEIMDNTL
jgi:hypothetical protein